MSASPALPATAPQRPRVLLVEDEAALRKLVAMVLEVLDIELLVCASGAEALSTLRAAPVQLLITDLMMPGMSGYALLQALADAPALRGSARVVVISAGLDAAARARLAPLGVWRLLGKPVGVRALEDCVREALASPVLPTSPGATLTPDGSAGGNAPDQARAEQVAIARYFAGRADLFRLFGADCQAQFPQDLQAGEKALAAHDAAALRRLGHSLKSVLRMLGHEALALRAQALEDAAVRGDDSAMAENWRALSLPLRRWVPPAPPPVPA